MEHDVATRPIAIPDIKLRFSDEDRIAGIAFLVAGVTAAGYNANVHSNHQKQLNRIQSQPLQRTQDHLTDQDSFISDTKTAVVDHHSANFIDGVLYDGKPHTKLATEFDEAQNRALNATFKKNQSDPVLAPILGKILAARSTAEAGAVLDAESNAIKSQVHSVGTQIDRIEGREYLSGGNRILFGAEMLGAVALGVAGAFWTRKFRHTRKQRKFDRHVNNGIEQAEEFLKYQADE